MIILRILTWIVYILGFFIILIFFTYISGYFSSILIHTSIALLAVSLWAFFGNYMIIEPIKGRARKFFLPDRLSVSMNDSFNEVVTGDEELINNLFSEKIVPKTDFVNPKLAPIADRLKPSTLKERLFGAMLILLSIFSFPFFSFLSSVILLRYIPGLSNFGILLLPLFFFWSIKLFRLGRRYLNNPIVFLSLERRDPLLYLRSFTEDKTIISERSDEKTYGQLIIDAISYLGPVIAVGEPGEKLPPLGAQRVYFANEEWKAGVLYLMSIARTTFIHADITNGVLWELKALRQHMGLQHFIICFLAWEEYDLATRQNIYCNFRIHAEHILGIPLPTEIGQAHFLYFDRSNTPKFIQINNKWRRLLFNGSTLMSGGFFSSRNIGKAIRPVLSSPEKPL